LHLLADEMFELWKAAAQMRGEVKTVASNATRTYYHLHDSTPEEIKESVNWLLKSSTFAYGQVDLKVL